jgi:hypothetical protein
VSSILECGFVVGGEVAVAIGALAGCGAGIALGKAPIAIGQEASPAEVCRQTKRAVQPMGERALGVELELEFELIQTQICMAQKPLLWVEVGKSACVLG